MRRFQEFLRKAGLTVLCSIGLAGAAAAQEVTLRLGHILAPSHPIATGADLLKKLVEEESGGRIRVEIYPAGQLGGSQSLISSFQSGLVDIIQISAGGMSSVYAPAAVFSMPFAFRDEPHIRAVMQGEIGAAFYDSMAAAINARPLATFYQLPRNLTSNVPVRSAADVRGLKIRVPEIGAWVAFWRKLGASPTPIDAGELFTSLQLGVVDAQENPNVTVLSLSLQEVQKYLSPIEYIRTLDWFVINNATLEGLSPEFQDIIRRAGEAVERHVNETWAAQDSNALEALLAAGMEELEPDVQSFVEAQGDLYKEFLGADEQRVFEAIQALR